MESGDTTSSSDLSLFDNHTKLLYRTQFWVFLFLLLPSIVFSLFDLYYLLSNRALRQALHNHLITILLALNLLTQLTDIPLYIHYFRTFESFPRSAAFRLFWGYLDWMLFVLLYMLYAWVTIERHFLIFHNQLFATKKKRLLFHYFPPIVISIYCCLFYAATFFIVQCENDFENLYQPVFTPCAFANSTLATYDIIAHSILPTLTIIISSILLLFRSVWQKYRIHQQIHWRHHRTLTIQVLSISFVYLILSFPYQLVNLLYVCGMTSYTGVEFLSLAVYGIYYTMFLFPIASMLSLPELRKKIKKILRCQRQHVVAPAAFVLVQMTNNPNTIR